MTITKEQIREKFERHWRNTRGAKKSDRELTRHPLQPQVYSQDSANRHWITWQAAYEAGRKSTAAEYQDLTIAYMAGRHDAKKSAVSEPVKSYWMIECSHGFTGWWTGKGDVDCRFFNPDPHKGKRFATKAEAEAVICNSCQIATSHNDVDLIPPAVAVSEPVAQSTMTAHRAQYFMERFKREEKLLGPNEQAALDFVIAMLATPPAAAVSEPVAQVVRNGAGQVYLQDGKGGYFDVSKYVGQKLYTTPPAEAKREPLSDGQITLLWIKTYVVNKFVDEFTFKQITRAIEAAHNIGAKE